MVSDAATRRAYKDVGVQYVRWVAEKDDKTCDECMALDGLVFLLRDVPDKPHYNCRCTLKPIENPKSRKTDSDRLQGTKDSNSALQSSSGGFKMNLQLFARKSSDYETVHLPADEYATVMHEINTNLSAEDRSKKVVTKAIGDYLYTFENNGFDNYRILDKNPICDQEWDEE